MKKSAHQKIKKLFKTVEVVQFLLDNQNVFVCVTFMSLPRMKSPAKTFTPCKRNLKTQINKVIDFKENFEIFVYLSEATLFQISD